MNFTVNKPTNWMGYCLDGQENVTIDGNATMTGLPNGLHNVTVYANGTYGNSGASKIIAFTVDEPASFPTTEAAAATTAIISIAGGIVYFIKKKH